MMLLVLQTHIVEDEGVDVGLLLEDLGKGLATAMAGLGVDADEDRRQRLC